jgi:hypothetical protein
MDDEATRGLDHRYRVGQRVRFPAFSSATTRGTVDPGAGNSSFFATMNPGVRSRVMRKKARPATESRTMLRTITRFLYAVVGAAFLLGGSAVLLLGTGMLPGPLRDAILAIGEDNTNTLHLMQEYAALLVLVALLTFWFLRHYEHSRAFHWAMTAFWGILALIHWFDPRGDFHAGLGEAVTSVPFGLFLVVGLLREKSEAVRAARA